jgi:hypothetical protein
MRHSVRATGPWEYYLRKVRVGLPQDCWEWLGSVGSHGYGNWSYSQFGGKRVRTAHRATYELFFYDPEALQVNHRCGNRRCCNPDHLYAGTQRQNWEDSVTHATASTPPNFYGKEVRNQFGYSKLDEDKVRGIRRRRKEGESGRSLAKEYGVSESIICAVYKRRSWGWVEPQ